MFRFRFCFLNCEMCVSIEVLVFEFSSCTIFRTGSLGSGCSPGAEITQKSTETKTNVYLFFRYIIRFFKKNSRESGLMFQMKYHGPIKKKGKREKKAPFNARRKKKRNIYTRRKSIYMGVILRHLEANCWICLWSKNRSLTDGNLKFEKKTNRIHKNQLISRGNKANNS